MAESTAEQTTLSGADKGDRIKVEPHDPYGHGHSVAAWAAVSIVMLGSLILSFGVGFANLPLSIVGAVIALAGGPIGKILGSLGLGAGDGSTR